MFSCCSTDALESVHIDMDDLAVFHFRPCCSVFVNNFLGCTPISPDGLRPARPVVTADSGFRSCFRYRVTGSARHRSKTMRPNHKENNVCVMSEPFSIKIWGRYSVIDTPRLRKPSVVRLFMKGRIHGFFLDRTHHFLPASPYPTHQRFHPIEKLSRRY